MAVLGAPVLGVAWSLGVWWAATSTFGPSELWSVRAIMLVGLGGLAQTLALWAGFGAVVWAMSRLMGLRLGLVQVLASVSAAAVPLWFAAPAFALWSGAGGSSLAGGLTILGAGLFAIELTRRLANASGQGFTRAGWATATALIFIASFLSLAG